MSADAELLRRYIEDRSEPAFAELVRRHLDLVYFAALRQVGGDAHRAKDVAQAVFVDLARKASALAGRATLAGWLHTSTRFAAAKLRRAEFSRQHYEQEAMTMNALLSDSDPAADWERLRPMIDDVVHELDERDREAVLLRFFENRPFAEIGETLRLSDDAARMRVDRALEKLRTALGRRGVNSTSAALAVVFANQVGATAPAGLAGAITGAACASVVTVGGAAAGVGIFMSKATTVITAAIALIAISSTFYQLNHAQRAETELTVLTVDRDGLRAQLAAEQQRSKRFVQDIGALHGEVEALKAKQVVQRPEPVARPSIPAPEEPLLAAAVAQVRRTSMNKAMLNNLRAISSAVDQFSLQNGRPPSSIQELVGQGKLIPALVAVNGEDYSSLSLVPGAPMVVTDSDGVSLTFGAQPLRASRRRPRSARPNSATRSKPPSTKRWRLIARPTVVPTRQVLGP